VWPDAVHVFQGSVRHEGDGSKDAVDCDPSRDLDLVASCGMGIILIGLLACTVFLELRQRAKFE